MTMPQADKARLVAAAMKAFATTADISNRLKTGYEKVRLSCGMSHRSCSSH